MEEEEEVRWVAIVGGCRYIFSCMHGLALYHQHAKTSMSVSSRQRTGVAFLGKN